MGDLTCVEIDCPTRAMGKPHPIDLRDDETKLHDYLRLKEPWNYPDGE